MYGNKTSVFLRDFPIQGKSLMPTKRHLQKAHL